MSTWTEARVDRAKRLWADGWSATMIARDLACGLSRNAVIGKLHRLGMAGRLTIVHLKPGNPGFGRPRQREARQVRPSLPKPSVRFRRSRGPHPGNIRAKVASIAADKTKTGLTLPTDLPTPPDCKPIPFISLAGMFEEHRTCRWPVDGEPGPDMLCCGSADTPMGKPYCRWHAARATAAWCPSTRLDHLAEAVS